MKRKVFYLILYGFVFATGATGLIYQVTWQKYLSRLLGSDSVAIAITLGTFLGGLSLGYLICGRWTVRIKNHFKGYAVLEGMIGAWGLLFPVTFQFVDAMSRSWHFEPPFMIILQGVFVAVLLTGLPTICMGGTIPFLTRGISQNIGEATKVHSVVYAVNTIGASLGAVLAGFYLIVKFGLPLTVMGTAVVNIMVFLFFFLISGRASLLKDTDSTDADNPSQRLATDIEPSVFPNYLLYIVAFLSGFYVMTLENVLIRIAGFSMGSSTYTFSIIVSVFIFSIASGSYIVSRLKHLNSQFLVINQAAIAILLLIVYYSLDTWPYWSHVIRVAFQNNMAGFYGYYLAVYVLLGVVLFFPVSLMGATVPILFHEIKRDLSHVGAHSGTLFSWNAFGNLMGSLIGGILFYYFFNNDGVFLMAAFLAGASACLSCFFVSKKKFYILLPVELALLVSVFMTPYYDIHRFMVGTFRNTEPMKNSFNGPEPFFKEFTHSYKHEFYKDDITASVSVVEEQFKDNKVISRSIVVNGKSDSSAFGDIYTLKLSAHLPGLLAQNKREAMVIGMGTGVTAGELTLYPEVEHIDVAEISPSVIESMPLFTKYNRNVMGDKRTNIHIGDAFRILGRSEKKWDIIISEPSNPWVTGVDLLFTDEFYKLVKAHLTEQGIFAQWFHSYSATPEMLSMVMNTLAKNFSELHLFFTMNETDLMALASDTPLTLSDIQRAEAYLKQNKALSDSLKEIEIFSFDGLLIREFMTAPYIRDKFKNGGLQTLDNPNLHYMAGKSFFMNKFVPAGFLANSTSAPYFGSYLLSLKYPDWLSYPYPDADYITLLKSTKSIVDDSTLPTRGFLALKQVFSNPDTKAISEIQKKQLGVDYLPLIMSVQSNPDWKKVNLEASSHRKRCEALITYMMRTRNWLCPYPVLGLVGFLIQGVSTGADPFEKNWFLLELIQVLIDEKEKPATLMQIYNSMLKDQGGTVLVQPSDKPLLEAVSNRLKELSSSGAK